MTRAAPIKGWKERLAAMDHSKGTTNVMRQNAMRAEISDLRKALRVERYKTRKQSETILRWRRNTFKYRADLLKERSKK